MGIEALEERIREGFVIEIASGVFLQSKDSLLREQKEWAEEDKSKESDFSKYEVWATFDCGLDPIGYSNLQEAIDNLSTN